MTQMSLYFPNRITKQRQGSGFGCKKKTSQYIRPKRLNLKHYCLVCTQHGKRPCDKEGEKSQRHKKGEHGNNPESQLCL